MRILLTLPSLDAEFGGPTSKAFGLAEALRGLGHEAQVVGCGAADGAVGLPTMLRFHGTPVPDRIRPLRAAVGWADVVHVIGYRDPVGAAAGLLARSGGIPYLLEPAGMYRRRLRSIRLKSAFDWTLGRYLVRSASVIVVNSELEAEELAQDGVERGRVRLRPNGIGLHGLLPLPERGAMRRRLGIPDEAPLALSLGRISMKKGLLHLVEAIGAIPGAWGLVAGPDDGDGTLAELRRAVTRAPWGGRIVLLPRWIGGREKAQALADADCFCLPSAAENFGNAAAEAACVGLPVVASDRCGVAEWLDPRGTRIVPYGDVPALGWTLLDALGNRSVRASATLAAGAVREVLDWRRIAAGQEAIYREIVR